MTDLSDAIDGMIRALDDEIAASRKGPSHLIHLSDGGRQTHPTSSRVIYRFEAERTRPLRAGVHGLLILPDGTEVPASVQDVRGDTVRLETERDLGAQVSEAVLELQNAHLLAWLRERLRNEARTLRTDTLAHRLISGDEGTSLPHSVALTPADLQALNAEQGEAVSRALAMDLTWVWGPPGTGKTATAAAIANAWARRDTTVLLTGPTNIAVDRLLLAFLRGDAQHGHLEPGKVIRVGTIELSSMDREYGETVSLRAEVARRATPLKQRLRTIAKALEELRATAASGCEQSRQRRSLLLEEGRRLDAQVEHLPQTVIDEAKVVATTAHRAGLGWLRREFDAAVVDEASMLSLAWTYAATIPVKRRAVVAGDPHQLGPVVQANSIPARRWMQTSAADLASPATESSTPHSIQLRSQYRMHPAICHLVARASYNGTLKSPATVVRRPLSDKLPGPLLYVDTGPLQGRCVRAPRGSSRMNRRQAAAVARLATWIAAEVPTCRGAVLTPYRAQRHLIQRELSRGPATHDRIHVGTIHSYQGTSAAFVIVDLADGPGLPPSRLLRGTRPTDPGPRLLTVALSRAEYHLIVVGNLSWLARAVPADAFLVHILRLLESSGHELVLPELRRGHPWPGNSHLESRRRQKLKTREITSNAPRDQ